VVVGERCEVARWAAVQDVVGESAKPAANRCRTETELLSSRRHGEARERRFLERKANGSWGGEEEL
jgi:hypothetical protein